jgi:hypothetical protein
MNDQSEGAIVSDLADAVGELTRRHGEFLSAVQRLRAELHKASASVRDYQLPTARLTLPPSLPRTASPSARVASLPIANAGPGPGGDGDRPGPQAADRGGTPRPITKRHYDYFAELDDLLARLPAKVRPEGPEPRNDH